MDEESGRGSVRWDESIIRGLQIECESLREQLATERKAREKAEGASPRRLSRWIRRPTVGELRDCEYNTKQRMIDQDNWNPAKFHQFLPQDGGVIAVIERTDGSITTVCVSLVRFISTTPQPDSQLDLATLDPRPTPEPQPDAPPLVSEKDYRRWATPQPDAPRDRIDVNVGNPTVVYKCAKCGKIEKYKLGHDHDLCGSAIAELGKQLAEARETIERMRRLLNDILQKAEKFITKVEDGRARSVETYADMKTIRDAIRAEIARGE